MLLAMMMAMMAMMMMKILSARPLRREARPVFFRRALRPSPPPHRKTGGVWSGGDNVPEADQ